MQGPGDIVSRIKSFFHCEEYRAKSILVTEGKIADKLFYIE